MKTIVAEEATLEACLRDAQKERVIVTRNGLPVAIVFGVEGLDAEQVELGASDEFWRLIADRRRESVVDRSELERRLNSIQQPQQE